MKKLFTGGSIVALLLLSTSVFAEKAKDDSGFAENKANIIKRVNEEKAMIDQFASCVNSANNQDNIKKCHEARHSAQEKMQASERDMKRAHLQEELKKLDEEGKNKH
jgi:hypothetical protein